MKYLLDTNLISEARKRTGPASHWLSSVDRAEVALSVVTLAELESGIRRIGRRDLRTEIFLRRWLTVVVGTFAPRILPVSQTIALKWGELSAQRTRPVLDTFIAATALVHDLVVVTRNVRDFEDTGVRVLNPWSPG